MPMGVNSPVTSTTAAMAAAIIASSAMTCPMTAFFTTPWKSATILSVRAGRTKQARRLRARESLQPAMTNRTHLARARRGTDMAENARARCAQVTSYFNLMQRTKPPAPRAPAAQALSASAQKLNIGPEHAAGRPAPTSAPPNLRAPPTSTSRDMGPPHEAHAQVRVAGSMRLASLTGETPHAEQHTHTHTTPPPPCHPPTSTHTHSHTQCVRRLGLVDVCAARMHDHHQHTPHNVCVQLGQKCR